MLISLLSGPTGGYMAFPPSTDSRMEGQKNEWLKLLKVERGALGSGGDDGKLETTRFSDAFTQLQLTAASSANF